MSTANWALLPHGYERSTTFSPVDSAVLRPTQASSGMRPVFDCTAKTPRFYRPEPQTCMRLLGGWNILSNEPLGFELHPQRRRNLFLKIT